jgi:hypothetical protein
MHKILENCNEILWPNLIVYKNIQTDQAFRVLKELITEMSQHDISLETASKYHELLGMLVKEAEDCGEIATGNLWKDHLLNLILLDENPFSLRCESSGLRGVGSALKALVKQDLARLHRLYAFDFDALIGLLKDKFPQLDIAAFPTNYDLIKYKNGRDPEFYFIEGHRIKKQLDCSPDWSENIADLATFYYNVGCGKFGKYWGFILDETSDGIKLEGVSDLDPVRLSDLIGYESQKKEILENIRRFVKGFPANNMLLYGDRGTGKSSTIKALIHEFGKEGLRLVEVPKYQLIYLRQIIIQLKRRPQRFIIFIDDLSFEEHETEYKYLKAMLEGSLEAPPKNVLICATSNRRHLIREFHSDMDDEIKSRDTIEEKLSLSDRFGITVIFPSPNQEEYLNIVEGIAKNRGIDLEPDKLRELALRWELWNNQRSGRTARQFVDDLAGKIAASRA